MNYLDFEKDLETLDKNLEQLQNPFESSGISRIDNNEINSLEQKIQTKLDEIYLNLDGWKKTKIARHMDRPRSKFYIDKIFNNFQIISGDRLFSEDESVIVGFAKINNHSVLVIGQEKGTDTQTRLQRNFGMMRPEGYRKCIRVMKLAENFNIPIITFVDTPGAYPGKGAEERGQAEAIAQSINCCLSLKVPIITIVIGEGGSGGAIALATSNKVMMLEHSIYSVISPEGCASILWKDATKSKEAAESMQITAQNLFEYKIIDEIIEEPKGGAHRYPEITADIMKAKISDHLSIYKSMQPEEVIRERKEKFKNISKNLPTDVNIITSIQKDSLKNIFQNNKKFIFIGIVLLLLLLLLLR